MIAPATVALTLTTTLSLPNGLGAAEPAPFRVLAGAVVDATGGVLPGATVTLQADGTWRETVTDAAGRFTFEGVPDAPAVLVVRAAGFGDARLDVPRPGTPVRVILAPDARSERVLVLGDGPRRVTSATRTDTLLREVPQSVTVIDARTIADADLRGLGDAALYVPGLVPSQGEGNRDAVLFRGNNSTSDFFVDGVRDDTQYFRDLYNVERVEALKGPNAMVFGRGGAGGVLNRVTRQADGISRRDMAATLGSWEQRRATADLGQRFGETASGRVTALLEDTGFHRDDAFLRRYGVNPTVALARGDRTTVVAGYELFHDERTADRGVPSRNGRPVETAPSTFFGDPDASVAEATVHRVSLFAEHRPATALLLRHRTSYADYDKFYQNVFAGGPVDAAAQVPLSAYDNLTRRRNVFSQTDVVWTTRTGRVGHTLLAGFELGRQVSDHRRQTGYFTAEGPSATRTLVPLARPSAAVDVAFRPSATDGDNHGVATVAALYAQDQVELSPRLKAVLGLRYDDFRLDLRDHRRGADLASEDGLLSPRAGLVYQPARALALYASYGVSYLPRGGEQLTSLSPTNRTLEPETFRNYEVGAKWDVGRALALSAAAYRLDRGNVLIPDPSDPHLSLLADAQRVEGVEIGVSGEVARRWRVAGGYAYQDGRLTRDVTATARAGATLSQLPRHTLSLWNRYDFTGAFGLGLGVVRRGDMFASTSNAVVVPGFTRVDAAAFVGLGERVRAQANVENVFDAAYHSSAHNDNNITPGAPRSLRVSVSGRF
jgi:catecholate siderophore receptor